MDINRYKYVNQEITGHTNAHAQILQQKGDDSNFNINANNYIDSFNQKIPELLSFYENNDFNSFSQLCSLIPFAISSMPTEIIENNEFFTLLDFICRVLSLNRDVGIIHSTLNLLPPILAKKSILVLQFIEKRSIFEKLCQFLSEGDEGMVITSLYCISYIVQCTPKGINFDFPLSLDFLREICDRIPKATESVLYLCSSVLQFWPPDFIHRDEMIHLGFLLFSPKPIEETVYYLKDNISFILSLCRIIKADPPNIYNVLNEVSVDQKDSFIFILSEWLTNNSEEVQFQILKLFYTLFKHVASSRAEIISYIPIEMLLGFAKRETKIRAISYKILSICVCTKSGIIFNLFNDGIVGQFPNDIDNGDYLLRKSILLLTKQIMKYGSFMPQTSIFYCVSYFHTICAFLASDSEKIISIVLEIIRLLIHNANNSGNEELIQATRNSDFINDLQNLHNIFKDDETISIQVSMILEGNGLISHQEE